MSSLSKMNSKRDEAIDVFLKSDFLKEVIDLNVKNRVAQMEEDLRSAQQRCVALEKQYEEVVAENKSLMLKLNADGKTFQPGDPEWLEARGRGKPISSGPWKDVLDRHKVTIKDTIIREYDIWKAKKLNINRMKMNVERDVRGLDPLQEWSTSGWSQGDRKNWYEREVEPYL